MLIMSSSVFAGTVAQGGLKVTKVMAGYQTGELYFHVDKDPLNPMECSNTSNNDHIFVVDPNKSDVSHVLSVLLTAKTTGSEIELLIYNDACFRGYAVIRRVGIL